MCHSLFFFNLVKWKKKSKVKKSLGKFEWSKNTTTIIKKDSPENNENSWNINLVIFKANISAKSSKILLGNLNEVGTKKQKILSYLEFYLWPILTIKIDLNSTNISNTSNKINPDKTFFSILKTFRGFSRNWWTGQALSLDVLC